MDTTPRKRVLKSVLLHSLQRYRQTARLPEDAFESANADYATYLAQMADNYDLAPEEMHVQEKAGFSGYDMWSETYDLETENPVILGEQLALGDVPERYPAATVLDVGAGTGRHAIPYARSGARVTALEPSGEMLSMAQAKADEAGLEIEFHNRDLCSPFDGNREFEVVLCCLVLSHVEDLASAMRFLCGRVSPNGHLIISDFHPFNLLVGMRTSFGRDGAKYFVPNFVHLPSEYVSRATAGGMRLVEFHETGHIEGSPLMPATLSLVFRNEARQSR